MGAGVGCLYSSAGIDGNMIMFLGILEKGEKGNGQSIESIFVEVKF